MLHGSFAGSTYLVSLPVRYLLPIYLIFFYLSFSGSFAVHLFWILFWLHVLHVALLQICLSIGYKIQVTVLYIYLIQSIVGYIWIVGSRFTSSTSTVLVTWLQLNLEFIPFWLPGSLPITCSYIVTSGYMVTFYSWLHGS